MSDDDFWLLPEGLDNQVRAFDRHAELMTSVVRWLEDLPLTESAEHQMYNRGVTEGKSFLTGLISWFSNLSYVLEGIATEIRAVADDGRKYDMRTAAELDALEPTEYNGHSSHAPGRASAAKITPSFDRPDHAIFPVCSKIRCICFQRLGAVTPKTLSLPR